jgi:hypothetical protein
MIAEDKKPSIKSRKSREVVRSFPIFVLRNTEIEKPFSKIFESQYFSYIKVVILVLFVMIKPRSMRITIGE